MARAWQELSCLVSRHAVLLVDLPLGWGGTAIWSADEPSAPHRSRRLRRRRTGACLVPGTHRVCRRAVSEQRGGPTGGVLTDPAIAVPAVGRASAGRPQPVRHPCVLARARERRRQGARRAVGASLR